MRRAQNFLAQVLPRGRRRLAEAAKNVVYGGGEGRSLGDGKTEGGKVGRGERRRLGRRSHGWIKIRSGLVMVWIRV